MRILIPFAPPVAVPLDDPTVIAGWRPYVGTQLLFVVVNTGATWAARAWLDVSEDLSRPEYQQIEDVPPGEQRSILVPNYGAQLRLRACGVGGGTQVKYLVRSSS